MGFKIICNKCNKEIIIQDGFEGVALENEIEIYATMDGRIIIECVQCGNDVTSK